MTSRSEGSRFWTGIGALKICPLCAGRSWRDSYHFQFFRRDADELEKWVLEKLQIASDENYKDPSNLQGKLQKHQAFEAEVQANAGAIVKLDGAGNQMIAEGHFAAEMIREANRDIRGNWVRIWSMWSSCRKSLRSSRQTWQLMRSGQGKLYGAAEVQRFNRDVDETIGWIKEKEQLMASDDFGRDLASVQALLRKHEGLERGPGSPGRQGEYPGCGGLSVCRRHTPKTPSRYS
ncbi:hypothetical protein SKAU_G00278980 [Synaphobranchus kaupii]|uniref:Uncharacterized protein n=1 Tax=Synaphobranchus kaupii TaxID=118154 RepID=A0A9Q1EWS9_SYNKA|nr:hypothetical protein SKAU_G00278980 [Synaphobranchus kaupii]